MNHYLQKLLPILPKVYIPNTFPRADVDIFTTTLFGVMDQINNENKKSVIMRDMNIDMIKLIHM